METAIIVVVILAALGFAIYRVFVRPSCSCGCGCGKKTKKWSGSELHVNEESDDTPVTDGKSSS